MRFQGAVKYVYKQMGRAINDHGLIASGDKVLVGVSGSAKSLVSLELLFERIRRVPVYFEVIPCFIYVNSAHPDEITLRRYIESLGVPCVVRAWRSPEADRGAFWCSHQARKEMLEIAREFSCNKIALGHHLDDIIETTMMNILFKGSVSTLKPRIELPDAHVTIIRPLCYAEKGVVGECFAQLAFPFTSLEHFGAQDPSRDRMRRILEDIIVQYPFVKTNIFRSLGRIRGDYAL